MIAAFRTLGSAAWPVVFGLLFLSRGMGAISGVIAIGFGQAERSHWVEALTKRIGQWDLAKGRDFGDRDDFWRETHEGAVADVQMYDEGRVLDAGRPKTGFWWGALWFAGGLASDLLTVGLAALVGRT